MAEERVRRRLTSILAADIAGYSTLVAGDEEGTLAFLRQVRRDIVDPSISRHDGRVANTAGDSLLVEFPSVVEAVRCAVEIQRALAAKNADRPDDRRVEFRIGINLGDVVEQSGDLLGDGVNIAARLESVADPGGICISHAAFEQVKDRVEIGFHDLGELKLRNIPDRVRAHKATFDHAPQNVARRGQRSRRSVATLFAFVGLIAIAAASVWYWSPFRNGSRDLAATVPGKLVQTRSIAVLPLENLSKDPDQGFFVTGLTEDLINALSRVPNLLVIAFNSTKTFDSPEVDIQAVGAKLGVRHVLKGSVQRAGDRLRVGMQLVDSETGANVWTERYDRAFDDLFRLQDDIVKKVVVGLQVELTVGETARILSRGTSSLEAWLYVIQATDQGFKFTREANARARELYQAAANADPNWAHPIGGLSWTYREAVRRGWSQSIEEDRAKGIALAKKATEMDPNEPIGYIMLGNLYIESGRFEEGIALREKAVEIAPHHFYALAGLAWQLPFAGEVKRALDIYARMKTISPILPGWLIASEALALHFDGQFERSIEGYRKSLSLVDFPIIHACLAAVYVDNGQIDEAREQIRVLLSKKPDARIGDVMRILNFQEKAQFERYADLLRTAGLSD